MGKVIMSGIVPPLTKPLNGILASDLAVGSTVKLMENGVAVDYLIVNQGIPSGSSLYDASCDGTWLLRKDIYVNYVWDSANINSYNTSSIHKYLNSTILNLFDSATQSEIKQVKIPYISGNGSSDVKSGANGISCKIFLLSICETGYPDAAWKDGEKLSYFVEGLSSDEAKVKRIAYYYDQELTACSWSTRTPEASNKYDVYWITNDGAFKGSNNANFENGIRPALILPSTALFDKDTLVFKGVK